MIQYKNIHDSNIILMYKGVLTFELLTSLIDTAEKRINEFEKERRVQKKFYSVLTESLQNMYYHIEKDSNGEGEFDNDSVLILISAKKKFYFIKTCNNILNSQVTSLTGKIDKVNAMGEEELKLAYRDMLANNEFSDKNTAGLGLMEIARKSNFPLKYEFEKINDTYSYFNFEIQLERGSAQASVNDKSTQKDVLSI